MVPNLKWSFSDSKTRIFAGGWAREQVVTDLPSSKDIAAAQQHLTKRCPKRVPLAPVAEWGYVYNGSVRVSAVDEHEENQVDNLAVGDIWYFPKGQAHTIQGLDDQNEYLLAFDDGNFDANGTTFNVDDWIAHTATDILAKNFGVDESVFKTIPTPDPYILQANVSSSNVTSPYGKLEGNSSYVYHLSQRPVPPAPGGGGTLAIVDSRNFPIATTVGPASAFSPPSRSSMFTWEIIC